MSKLGIPPPERRRHVHPATGEELGDCSAVSLGDLGGLTQFGAHLETLHPGAKSSVRHWHEHEDELVYVLSGELVLVEDEETPLRAGEAAAWPAGRRVAHRLENRSAADATYLIVGARAARDVWRYPDAGVTGVREGGRTTFTRDDGQILEIKPE